MAVCPLRVGKKYTVLRPHRFVRHFSLKVYFNAKDAVEEVNFTVNKILANDVECIKEKHGTTREKFYRPPEGLLFTESALLSE